MPVPPDEHLAIHHHRGGDHSLLDRDLLQVRHSIRGQAGGKNRPVPARDLKAIPRHHRRGAEGVNRFWQALLPELLARGGLHHRQRSPGLPGISQHESPVPVCGRSAVVRAPAPAAPEPG